MPQTTPIPSIKIILYHQGEVLFLCANGSWDLPGGRMEAGEHIMDCLHRELLEELGQDIEFISEPKLLRVNDYTPKADNIHRLYIYYSYELPGKVITDSENIKWLTIEQIEALDINDNWRQMILSVIDQ